MFNYAYIDQKRKYEEFNKNFIFILSGRKDLLSANRKLSFVKKFKCYDFYCKINEINRKYVENYQNSFEQMAANIYFNYFNLINEPMIRDSIPDIIYFNLRFNPKSQSRVYIEQYLIERMREACNYEL